MTLSLVTDQLDHNKSMHYNLSIRLSADGFSFSVYNPIRDSIMLKQSFAIRSEISIIANLKQAFKMLDFLSYAYKQVDVTVYTKRFTLVPNDLFDEAQISSLFFYNFPQKENDLVLTNELLHNKSQLLFSVNKSLYHFLMEKYETVQIYSSVTRPAEDFALRSRFGSEKKLYACVYRNQLDVYAYERGQLLLLNTYACSADSDYMYYLLLVWKQLQMDQLKDELYLVGLQKHETDLLRDLSDFIKNVSTLELDSLH